jgi:hypothetical protein
MGEMIVQQEWREKLIPVMVVSKPVDSHIGVMESTEASQKFLWAVGFSGMLI